MATVAVPESPWARFRRGRSHQPGLWAGRYLTNKARERQRDAATESARQRAEFHRNRDAAYRLALGLAEGEPLPSVIGIVNHSRAPLTAKRVGI